MCASRKYREQFSKAYKVLYKEGSLCYLTEILDSAQEGFPYLWVNGEKYVFSQDVLEAGRKLFQQFKMIQQIIRNIYERIMEEVNITVQDVLEDMGRNLQEFDHTWVAYEQIYVLELMLIEADARRFITEAIENEKELTAIEQREKSRGRIVCDHPEYN
jgi:3-oxoacyl-[acyl-carrier-protein] synthase III